MSCANARGLVSDYIDGDLEAPLAQALERHLTSCVSCPPLYASLVATLAELKVVDGQLDGTDRLVRRVVAAVKATGSRGGPGTGGGT